MTRKYRKPAFHVVGITAILLKGHWGPMQDEPNESYWP
jgi:hypothetical protein